MSKLILRGDVQDGDTVKLVVRVKLPKGPPEKFTGIFKNLNRTEFITRVGSMKTDLEDGELGEVDPGGDFYRDVLVGWEHFKDAKDNEVDFSEDALDHVLENNYYYRAIDTTFLNYMSGKTKQKN